MNKKQFTTVAIIDASSSMSDKIKSVKSGIIEIIDNVLTNNSTTGDDIVNHLIITQFAGHETFEVLLNITIGDAELDKNHIAEQYNPIGSTALRDAIGYSFELIPKEQDGVFINIITDGEENSSREFSVEAIKKLLASAKENKWAVTFMGTTEAAIETAVSYGITRGNTMSMQDSSKGIMSANTMRSASNTAYYASVSASVTMDDISNDDLLKKDSDV